VKIEISPTVRVTVGMLMLTLSIVFVADWLGLIPREQTYVVEQRKRFSESLAVQLTSLAQAGGIEHMRTVLTALVQRDDTIESAALRLTGGETLVEVGNHSEHWGLSEDGDQSTHSQIVVPIFRGDERWGAVQVRFREEPFAWASIDTWPSFLVFVAFLTAACFVLYFLFLRRALRELDPRQVIPERIKAAFNSLAEGVLILDDKLRIVLANTAFT
jgi:PAS domain-containing protein